MNRSIAMLTIASLLAASCGKRKPDAGAGSPGVGEPSASSPSPAGPAGGGSGDANPGGATLATAAPDPLQQAAFAATADLAAQFSSRARPLVVQLIDAIAAAHRAVPRDAWDPAAVVAAVGKDRARLFGWVRDRTALVPYRGSLRGPVGVMMDRVGNSLDRALLLAELLKQAGLEVRLANAALDPAQVAALVASTAQRARPGLPTARLDDTAALAAMLKLTGIDGASLAAKLAAEKAAVAAISERTRAQIDRQGKALAALIPAPAAAPAPSAGEGFEDHWWVQVHDGEAWSDLDPALPTASPGEPLATQAGDTLAPDQLGDDRRHTLTVRVVAELWHGDTRDQVTLLEHAFAPSRYYGQAITLQNIPLDMPDDKTVLAAPDPAAAARKALIAQVEFAPVLRIGAAPIAQKSVTDRGDVFDLTAGDGNTMRLGRALQHATSDSVGAATDLLGGLPGDSTGDPASPPDAGPRGPARERFTAEWLELELQAPGGSPQRVRRALFDAIGETVADRATAPRPVLGDTARLDRNFALIGQTELLPMFAQIPDAFVIDRTIAALVGSRDVIAAAVARKDPAGQRDRLASIVPVPGPLYSLALARFNLIARPEVYLDRLDLLALRRRLALTPSGVIVRQQVDIMANAIGVWPGSKDPRALRIAQGVADTALEGAVIGCATARCTRMASTSERFAAGNGAGWRVIGSPQGGAAGDREAGYAIVAPAASPASWWRIDPATGETLGMSPLGGSAGTEEAALNAAMVDNLVLCAASIAKCVYGFETSTGEGRDVTATVCVVGALSGLAGAGVIGAMGGPRWLALLLQIFGSWVG
jgi:hypothetical protein